MSLQARAEAAKTGELPHQFLLRVARGEQIAGYTPTFDERLDAAKAAAPYFAPRLAAQAVDLTRDAPPPREVVEAELDAAMKDFIEAGRLQPRLARLGWRIERIEPEAE